MCLHTLWLEVSQRVSHEKHVQPHVNTCLSVRCLSLFDLFLSLVCLYFLSILFISSILVIILHVVGDAEHKTPCAHAE